MSHKFLNNLTLFRMGRDKKFPTPVSFSTVTFPGKLYDCKIVALKVF